ncbi:uncharacterized protein LOC128733625 [Sabethes cyaneus]|uniref:uncharacterized protein LOC128733625 n=1 Tax=Sabethes cyaneus TaxID=53552 RepID=UPI00237EA800|nr:uncharacterized protein LOC128733625 [Sabethes cyaneus]
METSAGSAGMSALFSIKKEQVTGDESEQTEHLSPDARIVRKVTALDPLKLKLLSQETKNRLLSGLLAEKAKVKPPAPTTSSSISNSTSSTIAPASSAISTDETAIVTSLKVTTPETVPKNQGKPISATPSLFRRKKVIPIAIAKKIAQEEKSRSLSVEPTFVNSQSYEGAEQTGKEKTPRRSEPSETPEGMEDNRPAQHEEKAVTVEPEQRPTAFRRIKPKVSINITQSRPKKSILKKTGSSETKQTAVTLNEKPEEENRRIEEGRDAESTNVEVRTSMETAVNKDHHFTPENNNVSTSNVPGKSCENAVGRGNVVHKEEAIIISTSSRLQSPLQRMENNPSWMHNPVGNVITSGKAQEGEKDIVENFKSTSDKPVSAAKESVTVIIPEPEAAKESVTVVIPEPANSLAMKPQGQAVYNPAREIRRISRLPPNLAMKLVKCVTANSSKQRRTTIEKESLVDGTKTEDLPVQISSSLVENALKLNDTVDQIEKIVDSSGHVTVEPVFMTAETNNDQSVISEPANEICSIPQPPNNIASNLENCVTTAQKITSLESPMRMETAIASEPAVKDVTKRVTEGSVEKPVKEIRRISQLPLGVALKLMNSLKQRNVTSNTESSANELCKPKVDSKFVNEDFKTGFADVCKTDDLATVVAGNTVATSVSTATSITTTQNQSSVSDVPTNPNRKVEILSQVILPSASYNLKELLAGKSAEKVPPGQMSFKLPIPVRNRNSTFTLPMPIIDTCKLEKTENDCKNFEDTTEEKLTTVTTEELRKPVKIEKSKTDDYIPEISKEAVLYSDQKKTEPSFILVNRDVQKSRAQSSIESVAPALTTVPEPPTISQVSTMQSPIVSLNVTHPQSLQYQHRLQVPETSQHRQQLQNIQSSTQAHFVPLAYHQTPGYMNRNPQAMLTQNIVLNPASSQKLVGQRQTFAPTQLVLIQPSNPPGTKPSSHQLVVPQPTIIYRQQSTIKKNSQIIVPAPRLILTPGTSQQPHAHPQQQQHQFLQQPPQSPIRCIIPAIVSQKHAFQPVHRTSTLPQHQQHMEQTTRVIPKIVIDSSFVENDRPHPTVSNSSSQVSLEGPTLQHFSPCSQAIKTKLREKLRAKILQKESTPTPSAPIVDTPQRKSSSQSAPSSNLEPTRNLACRQRIIYHPHDFAQSTATKPNRPQIAKPSGMDAQSSCPMKQFSYGQGKKIYLTKISVTKPAQSHPSTAKPTLNQTSSSLINLPVQLRSPSKMHQFYEDIFYGFPQSTINSEMREYERFRQKMEHFERKLSPEPEPGATCSGNNQAQSDERITANEPTGETFIITELEDTAATSICREMRQTVVKHESGMPPKITYRRQTFVLDDSDCDIAPEQLPRIADSHSPPTEKEINAEKVKIEIKTEEPHEASSSRQSLTSDVDLKGENLSETEPDEDLARQILAIVQKEREDLGIDSPEATTRSKKFKKRKKKKHKRRRRRNRDANEKLVDLLMKHVDHKSLIADIVAAQQKQISVFELSSTDDESPTWAERVCSVKEEKRDSEPRMELSDLDCSSESMISDFENDESDTNIFGEILKPFTQKNSDNESILRTNSPKSQNETSHMVEKSVEYISENSKDYDLSAGSSSTKQQSCDNSALPITEPQTVTEQPLAAPRALKRKRQPILVTRTKIRKLIPHGAADAIKVANNVSAVDVNIDESLPDNDESVITERMNVQQPDAHVSSELSLVSPVDERYDSSKEQPKNIDKVSPFISEIVNEWDSSEDMMDEAHQTKTETPEKSLRDKDGDIPFRISKESIQQQRNLEKEAPTFSSESSIATQSSAELSKESIPYTSEPSSSRVATTHKSILKHRVSVRATDFENYNKKETAVQNPPETLQTALSVSDVSLNAGQHLDSPPRETTNAKEADDSVESLLKDWDTPLKKSQDEPMQLLSERTDPEKNEKPTESVKSNQEKIEISVGIQPTNQGKQSSKKRLDAFFESTACVNESENQPSTNRVLRNRRKVTSEAVKNFKKLSSTSNDCKQTPSKDCSENKDSQIPKLHKKSVSINLNQEDTCLSQSQTPAGRVLRSRSKSVFADKKACADDLSVTQKSEMRENTKTNSPDGLQQQQETKRLQCEGHKKVEEAGGDVETTEHKEEQSQQSIKPTPFISNRIPIPISSEDEDDAPLAKRRKVLRKKRSTLRTNAARRDLEANRRLFQSVLNKTSSTADEPESTSTSTYFIKTEPEDLQEYPEQSTLYESFGPTLQDLQQHESTPIEEPSIVGAGNFQITDNANLSTSFDHHLGTQAVPSSDHIFATPQPVKKRRRRTKDEIEAERQVKLLQTSQPKEAKGTRNKKQQKIPESFPPVEEFLEQEVICASCNQKIPTVAWNTHYATHSGLTYRQGIDPVIDFNDETIAVQIVTRFMKSHRQLTVQCDKCGVSKKSAVGMVSHRMICGLTAEQIEQSKVTCEHCKRRMMAVSMSTHLLGHCPVLKKIKQEQALAEARERAAEEQANNDGAVLNQRGRAKRKATTRAEKKIQILSYGDLILPVTRKCVTDGCIAAWNTQFRKANKAKCVYQDCEFTGSGEEDMRQHHLTCPSLGERFECKNCKYQANKTAPVMKHIKLKHADALTSQFDSSGTDAKISSESSDDEGTSGVDESMVLDNSTEATTGEDSGNDKKKKSKKRPMKMVLPGRELFNEECDVYREMVLDEVIELRSLRNDLSSTARDWTLKFRRLYYSRQMLFSELQPDLDVRLFSFDLIYDYIPKWAKSLRFTMRNTNLYNAPIQVNDYMEKWQQLDTFSGQTRGTDSMFYCGGPIAALDWLPVPEGRDKHEHQILAVVCKNDFDEYHLANRTQPTKCLIQIWDLGYLNNNSLSGKAENSIPILLYAIACDFGPIWSLKFCPSGCYNSTENGEPYDRLGLLAATGSDGDVYIYSLSRNYANLITNNYRIVKLSPVYRLTFSLVDSSCSEYEGHSAVRLSWSRAQKHSVIAAGYSNGAIAVWNLDSKSPLLKGTKEGTPVSFPIHRIYIPDSCITAIDLHYTENSRYLLVCNADRKIQIYDLHTGYLPVEVCSLNARSKVTAACWNTHFPVIVLAFDDVYAIDRCALTFHQPREIGVRLIPLYTITAEATDMSGNDWLSNHVIGTDGGDVLCHQPTAFVHHMAQKYNQQMKYILSSTMSIKITDESTDTSYTMFEKNFGLLFSDNDKNPQKMDLKSLQVKSYRRALLHEYPGIRINKVCWNPNEQSHQYYAVGYQAGFVRVRGFRQK